MIPTETAGLALAITSGLLKLGRRIDGIAAEEKATQGQLALPAKVDVRTRRQPERLADPSLGRTRASAACLRIADGEI